LIGYVGDGMITSASAAFHHLVQPSHTVHLQFRDIRTAKCLGIGYYIERPALFVNLEKSDYMTEINYARSIGDQEVVQ
jgi:hypothetical protein